MRTVIIFVTIIQLLCVIGAGWFFMMKIKDLRSGRNEKVSNTDSHVV